MSKQVAFFFIILVILVILTAYVFACERAEKGKIGGAPRSTDVGLSTYQLLRAGKGPHVHYAPLDERGTGDSTVNAGHLHHVEAFEVQAGPDGHVHDITRFIVPSRFEV